MTINEILLMAMKKTIVLFLVLLNLAALYFGASRFFVTFADVPMPMAAAPTELGHVYHKGMEDMRDFLFPSFGWLAGTMLINFVVAGIAVFGKWRN